MTDTTISASIAASTPTPLRRAPTLADRMRPHVQHALAVAIPPLVLLALLVGAWEWAASGPNASLPPPSKVWEDANELILNPFYDRGGLDKGLGLHLFASLQRVAVGFALSAVAGIALGLLVGSSTLAMRALDPLFQVLRTVPPLAWLPLALAAFREAQPSAIFVIFITAVWPIIINTAVGVRNVPQDYRNVARVIRLSHPDWFLRIVVPAAAPYIFTGLRIGVGLSWLAIIAAEMLTGGVGIGFFVWDAWNSSNLSDIIVALVYIGLVGFVLDRMMALLARVVTRGTSVQ
ncbi:nitrate ABC transporter permease [Roseomonas sp. HJA6]|uniref:Nitrate ABC transporter permease n=1 Tax=Roseomonas alba TaxID=2846776 RepID=A0ABS7A8L3_9PROT|nr:nitrate ABC transporter permease [Neoroseomonas alba]MBW6398638.1 nitrate ABC transporter permease [Neoroseomonas alba]